MHIVIEGPDLKEVNFNQVQRSEPLHGIIIIYNSDNFWGGGETLAGGGGGGIPGRPYPRMKPCYAPFIGEHSAKIKPDEKVMEQIKHSRCEER